jgi:hypothetical protein
MTATKPGPELIDPTGTTSGHVLTSTGGSTAPTFQAGGGGWEFVSKTTAASDTTLSWTGFETGYDYHIVANGLDRTADGSAVWQFGTGGTPTYQTTGYASAIGGAGNASALASQSHNTASINATETNNGGADAGEEGNFAVTIIDPGNSSYFTSIYGMYWGSTSTANGQQTHMVGGRRETAEAVTAVRLVISGGNWPTGDLFLYRRANS